jgi:hypothetical protein
MLMSHHPELSASGGGAVLAVHLQPGAGRTGVVGRYGDALRLRVAAPPTGNRADDAVVELVARDFNPERGRRQGDLGRLQPAESHAAQWCRYRRRGAVVDRLLAIVRR